MPNTMYSHHIDFDIIEEDYGYITSSTEHLGRHRPHHSESSPPISALTSSTTGLLSRTLFSHIPQITNISRHTHYRHQRRSTSSNSSPQSSSDRDSSIDMSRPSSSHHPTHIPLPPPTYPRTPNGGSPSGTPAPAQPLASPTSPRSSFLPSFIRNRSRAATITGRNSPRTEQPDPLATTRTISNALPTINSASAGGGRDGGGVTRSVSTPNSGGLANGANQGELFYAYMLDMLEEGRRMEKGGPVHFERKGEISSLFYHSTAGSPSSISFFPLFPSHFLHLNLVCCVLFPLRLLKP